MEFERLVRKVHVNDVMPFGPLQDADEQYEVRGLFTEKDALIEDPVTGSANACLVRYLEAWGIKCPPGNTAATRRTLKRYAGRRRRVDRSTDDERAEWHEKFN
ncbi:PhzF family phenazine biosynthesis protein [Erwinia tracheiphila]|uniref:PhzF family phenazine biosynthesis protein n=1 Tax=Erwinia tracheiphila TaxID=65700 RepID=UPI001F202B86|nr:PhzF family phenazine biosynthesis protein [Erwinia tracheiphila]UIA83079.1 PhzF family phenazine biosynthesis protein [Erwinia tracheiphila]UIA91657.1 PhzF family phenazine biosynthesis protein [Erwinia tracheiphila]